MTKALEQARNSAHASTTGLEEQVSRAEAAAARLEIILASMHDLTDDAPFPSKDAEEPRLRFVRRRPERAALKVAE